MASPFPPVKIPPKQSKSGGFNAWAQQQGIQPGVAADVQYWAHYYKLNPYYFASVLKVESGANPNSGVNSQGEATGIGQIALSHIGSAVPWAPGRRITGADLQTYDFNLRYSAYLLNAAVTTYGYENAYLQGYNPSDPNRFKANTRLFKILGKNIPGGVPSPGTAPTAESPGPSTSTDAYLKAKVSLDPVYMAYTGKTASAAQVNNYLKNPISQYELETRLSDPKKNPAFYKSPVWQTHAPSYEGVYQNIFGLTTTAPKSVLTYAIVHNLDQTAFETLLRNDQLKGAPKYATSEQYKSTAADVQSRYEAIYGAPDPAGMAFIDHATRQGWGASQIDQYLRAQPEYTSSPEYQTRALALASQMGLIQGTGGAQTALQTPQSPTAAPQQPPTQAANTPAGIPPTT